MWRVHLSQVVRLSLVFGVMAVSLLASAGAFAPVRADMPVLVIAPPWGQGPAEILRAAGGREITPLRAPFAVLGVLEDPPAARAFGAWAVWNATTLADLCGIELAGDQSDE